MHTAQSNPIQQLQSLYNSVFIIQVMRFVLMRMIGFIFTMNSLESNLPRVSLTASCCHVMNDAASVSTLRSLTG